MATKEYNEKIKLLKEKVRASLELCSVQDTPYLCRYYKEGENKESIINEVVERVKKGYLVGQVIIQLEREMNPNMIDD